LFILARTDEQDLQVYPYEVLKFIERARGTKQKTGDALKLLQISKGRGHFATTIKTREEDCWLLNKYIGHKYTKMPSLPLPPIKTNVTSAAEMLGDLKYGQWRKNRTASRKNRTERKNKTNRANRLNRSNRNRKNRSNRNRKNKTNRRNRH